MGKRDYKSSDLKFSIQECVREIDRELSMRKRVYPNQINSGKLTRKESNKRFGKLNTGKKYLLMLLEIMNPEPKKLIE